MKGGLGFKKPEGYETQVTPFQRRYASFMDDQLRHDPENFEKLSLIQERSKNIPRYYHKPKYIVQPKFGPYEEGVVHLKDTTVSLPILAARLDVDIQSDLRVRLPKKETLNKFRSRNWRQQKKAIFVDRFRLMEYVGVREVVPTGFLTH
jgi:hypothetical protein